MLPTCMTLAQCILPAAVNKAKGHVLEHLYTVCQPVETIQFDEWTGFNLHHYDMFMISVTCNVSTILHAVQHVSDAIFLIIAGLHY